MNVTAANSLSKIAVILQSVSEYEVTQSTAPNDASGARAIEECREVVNLQIAELSFYELSAVHQIVMPLRLEKIRRGTT